jgi:hypothetical protein
MESYYDSSNGILFDGVNDFMQTSNFTYDQPASIYMVFQVITWIYTRIIISGNTATSYVMMRESSPDFKLHFGTGSS